MATATDLRKQIEQLDRQIIELLARRSKMARRVHEHLEEDEDAEWGQDVTALWLEEGFDHGMEESPITHVCRAVMELGKKLPEM